MKSAETVCPRLTFADLERTPDDGRRYELYDGEVVMVPSPFPLHQILHLRFAELLSGYVRSHGGLCVGSRIDIVLSEYDVLQADVQP